MTHLEFTETATAVAVAGSRRGGRLRPSGRQRARRGSVGLILPGAHRRRPPHPFCGI